jgi:hypothetical protein
MHFPHFFPVIRIAIRRYFGSAERNVGAYADLAKFSEDG